MLYGSFHPGPAPPTRMTFDQSGAGFVHRCARIEQAFRTRPLAALARYLHGTRPLHARLFRGCAPGLPQAVGTWRGERGTALENAQREVRVPIGPGTPVGTRPVDSCLAPDKVGAAMARLGHDLDRLWALPTGDGKFLPQLAACTWAFFHIHPFLDGNGHVWRLMVIALVRRHGRAPPSGWHVHPRPYGQAFSHALQQHDSSPVLLADFLDETLGLAPV